MGSNETESSTACEIEKKISVTVCSNKKEGQGNMAKENFWMGPPEKKRKVWVTEKPEDKAMMVRELRKNICQNRKV